MKKYVIACGTLVDGTGHEPVKNVFVVVDNGRIVRITKVIDDTLKGLKILDAKKSVVIPGLIDAHKHVLNCGGSGMSVGLDYKQLKTNIYEMSKGGVTSVLDLGSANIVPMLEKIIGSDTRIFNAISIITCKGGYPQEYMPKKFYKYGSVVECATNREIEKIIRKLYNKGVAAIKTAIVSRTFDGRPQINWTEDRLRYLTDTAHSYGLNVCAHITYINDYEMAADCGVDSVHHAAFDGFVDKRVQEKMIDKGIIFVPTISLASLIIKGLKERWIYKDWYRPAINDKIRANMENFTEAYFNTEADQPIDNFFIRIKKRELESLLDIQMANLKSYVNLGGTVAMGTDSALGFSLHNTPVEEIRLLKEAGLSFTETIKAATLNSAKVFGKDYDLGSIEVGKRADILIIDGDIENDITEIDKIKYVIIDGEIIHRR